MNRIIITTVMLAICGICGPMPAHAQQPVRVVTALMQAEGTTPERARELLSEGDRDRAALRLRGAERAYSQAARLVEGAGLFPEQSLWKLATVQHGQGAFGRAADTLDRLAELAERHGRPGMQARALLEAVFMHLEAGNVREARLRVERLAPLQTSPHLSTDFRAEIERRLIS